MGAVRRKTQRKKWTPEEEELLRELYQRWTKRDIAKKLKRSPASISNKKNELGIDSLMDSTELWNFTQISEAVGKAKGTINKSWVSNGLKFVRRGCYCLVKEKDLLRFMQDHPNLWDATKCDYYLFYRYPWFIEKLEADKKKPKSAKRNEWTEYEESVLITLKKRKVTHAEIAKRLGRTEKSITSKVIKMGLAKRKEHENEQ